MKHIVFENWQTICPNKFETGMTDIPNGLVYCTVDHIATLFRRLIADDINVELIIVSAGSDYGVSYNYNGILTDKMKRWLPMVNVAQIQDQPLIQPQRMRIGHYLHDDQYVANCYSWCHASFAKIPKQVKHWYCTNCDILDPKCSPIPFGIQPQTANIIDRYKLDKDTKEKKLFVCYGNTTNERLYIKRTLSAYDWVVMPSKLNHADFLRMCSECLFTFCPTGNGLDSYRILESLYLGSIPVIESGIWTDAYKHLPHITLPSNKHGTNWSYLNLSWLMSEYEKLDFDVYEYERLDHNWWKDKLYST